MRDGIAFTCRGAPDITTDEYTAWCDPQVER
jgi:hypothetical protein